jgi:hypothetical protein
MPIIRSPSDCRCSIWFPYECAGGSVLSRPRLRTLPPAHSYGNQRLQRQFDGLLMMGIVMPETCWAVSVRQGNKFYDWLLHLVGCFIRIRALTWKWYWSQWPHGQRHGSAVARLLGIRVRIPPGHGYLLRVFVLSGRGFFYRPIPHPDEWVSVCVCVYTRARGYVSLSAIRCNNNTLRLQWMGRRGHTKKQRNLKVGFYNRIY